MFANPGWHAWCSVIGLGVDRGNLGEALKDVSDMKTTDCTVEPEALVFIVDDEPMVGLVAQSILQERGFRTRFFSDPLRALHSLGTEMEAPALLLTDFQMNPINGMQLIASFKEILPRLKTVLYSGSACRDLAAQYQVGPDRIVKKPFLPEALIGQVESALAMGAFFPGPLQEWQE